MKLEGGAKKWRSWSGYQYFGIGDEEFLRLLNRFYQSGGCRTLRPYKKSISFYLDILSNNGWSIIFVTKRASYTIMQTVHSLIDLGVCFDKIYSIDKIEGSVVYDYWTDEVSDVNALSKYDIFMKEKPLVVIDDAPHYIEEAISAGVKSLFLINHAHNENWRRRNKNKFPQVECIRHRFIPEIIERIADGK